MNPPDHHLASRLARKGLRRLGLEVILVLIVALAASAMTVFWATGQLSFGIDWMLVVLFFVVGFRLLSAPIDELLIRGHWSRFSSLPVGRAVVSLVAAVGLVKTVKGLPSVYDVLWALWMTAPADATLAGYVDGLFFVGAAMLAFDPALRELVFLGLPALVTAVLLEGVRKIYHRTARFEEVDSR